MNQREAMKTQSFSIELNLEELGIFLESWKSILGEDSRMEIYERDFCFEEYVISIAFLFLWVRGFLRFSWFSRFSVLFCVFACAFLVHACEFALVHGQEFCVFLLVLAGGHLGSAPTWNLLYGFAPNWIINLEICITKYGFCPSKCFYKQAPKMKSTNKVGKKFHK